MAGSSSSNVGEDVLMDILSRLCVKSLLRLKCICKFWYSLIQSSYFIDKHLQRNLMNQSSAPLFVTRDYTRSVSWISSTNNEAVPEEVSSKNLESLPFSDGDQVPFIVGPVNGIYCAISKSRFYPFRGQKDFMFLFNPAVREFKAIPTPMLDDRDFFKTGYRYGFGYDSRSNDFKVVAVVRSYWHTSVLVYSSSSNSWRKLDSSNMPVLVNQPPAVFASHGNGAVHWLARDGNSKITNSILSFDMGTEVFRKSPLPVLDFPDPNFYIIPSKDSVAIFSHSRPSLKYVNYEIWVMREYGADESWTKLYNIRQLPECIWPVMFWNNGEILFRKSGGIHNLQLVSYDPTSQQIKLLYIGNNHNQVVTYLESLISIHGLDY